MTRTSTWDAIGTNANKGDSFMDLMHAADLDYNIVKQDLLTPVGDQQIIVPNYKATVREDTGEVYGIVTDRYQVCQNYDALGFVQFIDGIELLKAGETHSKDVYLIGQLPEVEVLGDVIRPHIIFQNSHNGSSSVKATITMLRTVCQNQFTRSFKESPATITITHSGDMKSKLKVAEETLSKVYNHIQHFQLEAEELAGKKITSTRLNKIMEQFFYTSPEFSDRRNQRILDDREKFQAAFQAEDNANFTKSMWGLVNSFADFTTHQEPARKSANWAENQFMWMLNPQILGAFIDACKAA